MSSEMADGVENADGVNSSIGSEAKHKLWRDLLTPGMLGSALCGVAINAWSDDLGHLGLMFAGILYAVLVAGFWVRKKCEPRSAVTRYTPVFLLVLASTSGVATLVAPQPWARSLTFVAVILVLGAALVPVNTATGLRLLGGGALVGGGAVMVATGIGALLNGGDVHLGIASVVTGAVTIGMGVSLLRIGDGAFGKAPKDGRLTAPGVRWVGPRAARMRLELFGFGLAMVAFGGLAVQAGQILVGAGLISAGVATDRIGAALVSGAEKVRAAMTIDLGASIVVGGVAVFRYGMVLPGLALTGFGVAVCGAGIHVLRDLGVVAEMRGRLVALTRNPPAPGVSEPS